MKLNLPILKPLPDYLVQRYYGWKATTFANSKSWYHKLAEDGQHPRAMIISCCDSRVHVTSIFGSDAGEFFIHRNIANLVPPFKKDEDYHGTSAAIEYAVKSLKIPHIIILGHSTCGGVKASYDYFSGKNPSLKEDSNFVASWLEILRTSFNEVSKELPDEDIINKLEKEAVLTSVKNLTTFPFIQKGISDGSLSIHGLWHNIGKGELMSYDNESNDFILV
ncbi:carbonic anhydrase [Candidatus Levibacter sp. Uisw_134_01]|uniref:carbonic anhydrase n=1 Tax=Candidatus Levibacter sp. Uisw_134_01 TaxID=3230999 RepID=UPI003D4AD482